MGSCFRRRQLSNKENIHNQKIYIEDEERKPIDFSITEIEDAKEKQNQSKKYSHKKKRIKIKKNRLNVNYE